MIFTDKNGSGKTSILDIVCLLYTSITPAKISDVKFAIKKGHELTYDATQKKPSIAQDEDTTTTKIDYVSENDAAAQVKLGSVVISQLFDITYGTNVDAGKDLSLIHICNLYKSSGLRN